jgi:hypothetical protein
MTAATPADCGRLCELLQVRGNVYVDPDDGKLERKRRVRIEWQTAIPLLHNGSLFKKPVRQWMPPPALISSRISTV